MGFAPPEDFPPPEVQDAAAVEASFAPSPSGPSLCGFGIPTFSISLRLPSFQFPPAGFPPQLSFGLALACNLSDPISASFGFGGGRVSTSDPDADEQFENG